MPVRIASAFPYAGDCFAVLRTARNDKFRKTVIARRIGCPVIASGVAARQSHALNTYSCFSFLMRGIASQFCALLAMTRNPVSLRAA